MIILDKRLKCKVCNGSVARDEVHDISGGKMTR